MSDQDIYRDTFPIVLRTKRADVKITQEELSGRAEIGTRYVSHLENGSRHPTISVFCKLAYALETTPTEFMAELEAALPEKSEVKDS